MFKKLSVGYRFLLIATLSISFTIDLIAQNPKRFVGKEENMGSLVNSPYDELDPVIAPDGETLYFTRSRHPENTGGRNDAGDIWVSKKDEAGNWTLAQNAGERLNNQYYNAVIGFSSDGNTVFLQHHYFETGNRPRTQGFSYATKEGNQWSTPKKATIDNFYNKSPHQSMSISEDGKIAIMAINSFGSYGYEDLYVTFRLSDGSWTAPKNMGSTINTSYQEMTPYLCEDNTTLYFASSGHNSMGSRDIFVAKRLDHSWRIWSEPENISEVNSEGVELSYKISPDGTFGYYISTQNSDGYGDIHTIKLNPEFTPEAGLDEQQVTDFVEPDTVIVIPQNETTVANESTSSGMENPSAKEESLQLTGNVLNKKNNTPIDAKVSLVPVGTDSEKLMPANVENGTFLATVNKANNYKIKISAEGFMTEEVSLDLSNVAESTISRTFHLTPLEAGATFQLNNVLFERGTASLVDSSYLALDKVAEMMQENPQVRIEIAGHTDNQGDARLNLKLSQQRVETVLNYLIEKGISEERLTGRGYGGTKPIASNRSETTRKLNRRVEFTILNAE